MNDENESVQLIKSLLMVGFTQQVFSNEHGPVVMILSKRDSNYLDLAHIRGEERADVCRMWIDEHANLWRPRSVVWHCYDNTAEALGQLFDLPEPRDFRSRRDPYPTPRDDDADPPRLTITDDERALTETRHAAKIPFAADGRSLDQRMNRDHF